jgi:hypothetical protein
LVNKTNFEDLSAMQQNSAPVKSSKGKGEATKLTEPDSHKPRDSKAPVPDEIQLPEKRMQSETIQQSQASQRASDALMTHEVADEEQAAIEGAEEFIRSSNRKEEPGL